MDEKPYQSKKKLMAMVRRGDYVSISSSNKQASNVNDTMSEGVMSYKSRQSSRIGGRKRKNTLSSSSIQQMNSEADNPSRPRPSAMEQKQRKERKRLSSMLE